MAYIENEIILINRSKRLEKKNTKHAWKVKRKAEALAVWRASVDALHVRLYGLPCFNY